MNKIIKDACILFAITLVAGIVLGAVYNITKGPIAEQNEKQNRLLTERFSQMLTVLKQLILKNIQKLILQHLCQD